MKHSAKIYGKRLAKLLNEVPVFDEFALCNVICDYYSKYETPMHVGNSKFFKMIALSNEGHRTYCTPSRCWEHHVPYKRIADVSRKLAFEVLVFAASWDGFSEVKRRVENLDTPCALKVFAIKSGKDKELDKEVILQLVDWIDKDIVPTAWREEVSIYDRRYLF